MSDFDRFIIGLLFLLVLVSTGLVGFRLEYTIDQLESQKCDCVLQECCCDCHY